VKDYKGEDRKRLEMRLAAFYRAYTPEVETQKVGKALTMNVTEGELFEALKTRYGPEPSAAGAKAPAKVHSDECDGGAAVQQACVAVPRVGDGAVARP
jgi:hypothetical protein